MQVNGYMLKDREEELQSELKFLTSKLYEVQYFKSESDGVKEAKEFTANYTKYVETASKLEELSSLHCRYNSGVIVSGATLQSLIKRSGNLEREKAAWVYLSNLTKSNKLYKTTNEEYEYPEFVVDNSHCQEKVMSLEKVLRELKKLIRQANSTMIEIDSYEELIFE